MEVSGRKQDNFFIVEVRGRMDALSSPEFEKACLEWIGQGESRLIVNFEGLEYISSAGLRSILVVGKKLKSAGGNLVFSSLSANVAHVFSIAGLGAMFPVHESLEQALKTA